MQHIFIIRIPRWKHVWHFLLKALWWHLYGISYDWFLKPGMWWPVSPLKYLVVITGLRMFCRWSDKKCSSTVLFSCLAFLGGQKGFLTCMAKCIARLGPEMAAVCAGMCAIGWWMIWDQMEKKSVKLDQFQNVPSRSQNKSANDFRIWGMNIHHDL